MKSICILCASVGQNLVLSQKIQDYLNQNNVKCTILNLVELNLPMYSTPAEAANPPATIIAPFQNHLNADAFFIVSPEYNGGTPPVLTNFFAWVSRATKDWRKSFSGKSAALATHSGGGMYILPHLRIQLAHIGLNVVGRQIHTTMQKPLNPEDLKAVCDLLLKQLH